MCAEGANPRMLVWDGGGRGGWTEGGVPRPERGGEGHQVAQVALVSVLTAINDHTSLMDNRHRVLSGQVVVPHDNLRIGGRYRCSYGHLFMLSNGQKKNEG